jgi:hypothetical protein
MMYHSDADEELQRTLCVLENFVASKFKGVS